MSEITLKDIRAAILKETEVFIREHKREIIKRARKRLREQGK